MIILNLKLIIVQEYVGILVTYTGADRYGHIEWHTWSDLNIKTKKQKPEPIE